MEKFTHKLNYAFELIDEYHKGQLDKAGKPYKLHLLSVKNIVEEHLKGEKDVEFVNSATLVALLHDILEDTDCPLSKLQAVFSEQEVEAIQLLTKPKKWISQYMEDFLKNEAKLQNKQSDHSKHKHTALDLDKQKDLIITVNKAIYFKKIKENKLARIVKIADITHNSNLQRLPKLKIKDIKRTKEYLEQLDYLLSD